MLFIYLNRNTKIQLDYREKAANFQPRSLTHNNTSGGREQGARRGWLPTLPPDPFLGEAKEFLNTSIIPSSQIKTVLEIRKHRDRHNVCIYEIFSTFLLIFSLTSEVTSRH